MIFYYIIPLIICLSFVIWLMMNYDILRLRQQVNPIDKDFTLDEVLTIFFIISLLPICNAVLAIAFIIALSDVMD